MNITLSSNNIAAQVNPNGAELTSFIAYGREYIWDGDPAYWGKHSPVLFPIVGTLKNNSYLYEGNIYALSRHGFARDSAFDVKEQNENRAVFSLQADTETKRVYPFDFELELHYSLKDCKLEIKYVVRNNGKENMPFSIGAHPAFTLPEKFTDYSLKFELEEKLVSTQLENDLLSDKTITLPLQGNILPLDYKLFEKDALILKSLKSNTVTIAEKDRDILKVSFEKFSSLGLWTKPGAPFICVEPWQGYSDHHSANGIISEKEGILLLHPGQEFDALIEIEILG